MQYHLQYLSLDASLGCAVTLSLGLGIYCLHLAFHHLLPEAFRRPCQATVIGGAERWPNSPLSTQNCQSRTILTDLNFQCRLKGAPTIP